MTVFSKTAQDTLINNLSKALWDSDLVASRLTLALGEFAWVVMLFWPGNTFDRPTYTYMSLVASETAWGIVFLLSCITQLTVVLSGDFNSKFSRYFSGWNAVLWMFVGIVSPLLSVYPPPAAMGGEMALAFSAMWIWARPYFLAEGLRRASRY